ncbi:MAG: DHH family phosphoesterase, partial [Lachnospiraceae bacterium]|nr:DHH family phosphoesterase [Lachnospiraceae bacterium]
DITEDLCDDDEVILVDAQKGNSNIIDMTGMEIICIDHHPIFEKPEYRYTDIRPEIGACATIIAQYYFENAIPMDERIATALTYAIRSDTDKLSRGVNKSDIEMLYRMHDISDGELIQKLENAEIYFDDLAAYSKAIESIRVYDKVSFASVGENCPEALIASVSDFMLAVVEVEFSVVYAIQKNGIKLSVRSEGGYDAGRIISKALKGFGNGGGHAAMAGGFVPLAGKEERLKEILDTIQERVLEEVRYS